VIRRFRRRLLEAAEREPIDTLILFLFTVFLNVNWLTKHQYRSRLHTPFFSICVIFV